MPPHGASSWGCSWVLQKSCKSCKLVIMWLTVNVCPVLPAQQVAADKDDRQDHLLQAQSCAHQLLISSLLAAGADPAPTRDTSPAGAAPRSSASSDGSGTAAAGADAAATAGTLSSSGQAAAAAVPPLPISGVADAAADSLPQHAGLAKSTQLPRSPSGWAFWLPADELLQTLQGSMTAATMGSSCTAAGTQPLGPRSARTTGADQGLAATVHRPTAAAAVTDAASQGLVKQCSQHQGPSRAALPFPELLLANLQVLSEQLAAAGRHAACLPVLQLARLVAKVTLGSQVSCGPATGGPEVSCGMLAPTHLQALCAHAHVFLCGCDSRNPDTSWKLGANETCMYC